MWSDWHIRLKAAAKAKGKTDALLADELQAYGIEAGRAAVNHWLNNKRPIALNAFFAICELLEVDPAEILFEISAYTSHSLRPGVQAAIAYEALPAEDRPAARRVLKMPETETARRPKKGVAVQAPQARATARAR